MARILIADDDVILTEMLRFRLEALRHEVIIAPDGMAAIEALEKEPVDLVVLDSMMPVVAGPEVLARIKSDPATAQIPVVMLTARKSESDVLAALKGGVDEYLTKPFIPQELLFRIAKLLGR
ncbi:response regulator [Erythrobacter sp. SDW2]|uniref:response regulator transcription factor n=1 Tax=Erythrobacter sp. SDW2 TaxID=2907154 RepID=UPI001F331DCB|nr:response regulator [Erythrobacter sp. SDW2]UIP07812.1 response regulator [Erythrobacter sp. SDW2]